MVFRLIFTGDDNPQQWSLHYLKGEETRSPTGQKREIGIGSTGETTALADGGRIWVGVAGDPFWLDAVAAKVFLDGALANGPWQPESFSTGMLTTGAPNVIAIVAEYRSRLLARAAGASFPPYQPMITATGLRLTAVGDQTLPPARPLPSGGPGVPRRNEE